MCQYLKWQKSLDIRPQNLYCSCVVGIKPMETNYRVIGFGEYEHGFFNQFAWALTLGYAQGIYNAHLEDPEMDGAVLIQVQHETWEVIQEFGTDNVSVEYGPLGNFKVTKAPRLVMV
jgi:hypothetical protein